MEEIELLSRFPQPFIDEIRNYVEWSDIMNLLSCSKQENSIRVYWINNKSRVKFNKQSQEERTKFISKYRKCHIKQTIYDIKEFVNVNDTLTTHIYFSSLFNQSLDDVQFPKSLKYLNLGHAFNKPLDKVKLPESLTHLIIGNMFGHSLDKVIMPRSLLHFELGNRKHQSLLPLDNFPSTMIYMKLAYGYSYLSIFQKEMQTKLGLVKLNGDENVNVYIKST